MRVGITRAILIETVDRGAGASKRYRFRASSGGQARGDNYVLDPAGWQLDNYRQYPVILAAHDASRFPIGVATSVETDSLGLIDEVQFDDGDPLGADAMRKLDSGIPIAQSVSFRVLEIAPERDPAGLIRSKSQELYEISMVGLPSDPAALPMRSLADFLSLMQPETAPSPALDAPSLLDLLAGVRLQAARLAEAGRDGLTDAQRVAIEQTVSELAQLIRHPQPEIDPALLSRLGAFLDG